MENNSFKTILSIVGVFHDSLASIWLKLRQNSTDGLSDTKLLLIYGAAFFRTDFLSDVDGSGDARYGSGNDLLLPPSMRAGRCVGQQAC